MNRGSRTGRSRPVRVPRPPHRGFKPHPWAASDTAGVCAHCPLSAENAVHDEATIAAAELERDQAQAEHARRAGD